MNTNYSNNVSFGSMFYLRGGLKSNIKELLPREILETAEKAGVAAKDCHVKITDLSKIRGITFISVPDNIDKSIICKAFDKLGCLDVGIQPCSDEFVKSFY